MISNPPVVPPPFQVASAIVHVMSQLDELIALAEEELAETILNCSDPAVKSVFERLRALKSAHSKLMEADSA